MSERKLDRRTLLKALAAAGAAGPLPVAGPAPARAAAAGPRAAESRPAAAQADVAPFTIQVADEALEDLQRRLAATRWPPDSPGEPWSYGTDRAYLEELIAYWRDEYDWRAQEAALNAFDHYTTEIEGQRLHFVHQRSPREGALPLLLTHGWPGTVWEMLPSVGPLADPAAHGGDAADGFHVVAPSIPGFGFSGEPLEGTDIARTAELWVALMDRLGYERFGAYGSDWGAGVTRALGAAYPDRVVGIHTPGRAPPARSGRPRPTRSATTSPAPRRGRSTRPATSASRAPSLRRWPSASPTRRPASRRGSPRSCGRGATATATWRTASARTRFSPSSPSTGTRAPSARASATTTPTASAARAPGGRCRGGPVRVPQGFAQFVGIPSRTGPPRSFVEDIPDNVTHWSVFDTGGHFPAIEEPALLVGDLRRFFRTLR